MNIVDRAADLISALGDGEPLQPQDQPLWAAAETLEDLGDLTARWLAGDIRSQPGYYGPVDVDEDDAPGLTDTLIVLNRTGMVTDSSQAGLDRAGYDGAHWTQLAAVSGFADTATVEWLQDVVADTRFEVFAHPVKRRFRRPRRGVVVTRREGLAYTRFGLQLGRSDLATIYDGVGDEAFEAVCAAWQVTVYDPRVGFNDLWPVLAAAAEARLEVTAIPAALAAVRAAVPAENVQAERETASTDFESRLRQKMAGRSDRVFWDSFAREDLS